jgi:hypothetical protein
MNFDLNDRIGQRAGRPKKVRSLLEVNPLSQQE